MSIRDERGNEIHWSWLRAHWHAFADKLELEERRFKELRRLRVMEIAERVSLRDADLMERLAKDD